jgi:hypothetical protein
VIQYIELICICLWLALTFYEYIITASDEVATVWQRKINVSSAFLLSIRWTMVLSTILALVPAVSQVNS